MKWLLWLIPVGALAYFLIQRKKQTVPPTGVVTNANTATKAPDPFWGGWKGYSDRVLKNTSATISDAVSGKNDLLSGVDSWFGGSASATGSASDVTTSSGGVGVPVDDTGNVFALDPNYNAWTFA